MDQTGKLAVLATILAMTALAAGCVPALDYGSVPPEPKITTKLTTTTAVSTTRKPFTTPKRRTGTVSWEELFGEEPYEKKKYYNNDDDDSYSGYVPAGTGGLEIVKTGAARDNSRISGNIGEDGIDYGGGAKSTGVIKDQSKTVIFTKAPAQDVQQEPQKQYQPEPEPQQQYQPEPEPQKQYQPEPEPQQQYQPEPEPQYQPEPEPQYQPEPAPSPMEMGDE